MADELHTKRFMCKIKKIKSKVRKKKNLSNEYVVASSNFKNLQDTKRWDWNFNFVQDLNVFKFKFRDSSGCSRIEETLAK